MIVEFTRSVAGRFALGRGQPFQDICYVKRGIEEVE